MPPVSDIRSDDRPDIPLSSLMTDRGDPLQNTHAMRKQENRKRVRTSMAFDEDFSMHRSLRDHLATLLWNELTHAEVLGVALDMHRLCKTGSLPYRELMTPPEPYPPVGAEKKSASDPRIERGFIDGESKPLSTRGVQDMESCLRDRRAGVDFWGRVVPKEPTAPVNCVFCNRSVSATRLAIHLDKCLGLGNHCNVATKNMNK
mmetsp:Transcript_9547/g.21186  ORF Transcript_9547/g.21186 Transcript_9547/m.21186 type:complete len:203 (-) Transcript_9547:37-645(-)